MNLFFSAWWGKFWWKFGDFPNGDIFYTVDWKCHHTKVSLFIKFCWSWWCASVWISGLAINHNIKQVNCLWFIFGFFIIFFVEVNTNSQSPIMLSFFHVNNSPNIHVRKDIFWYSAEIFNFSLMIFCSFM
mgnify:CR=1 FL=1